MIVIECIWVCGLRFNLWVRFLFIISMAAVLLESVEDVFVVIILFIGLNVGCSVVRVFMVVFGWIILL